MKGWLAGWLVAALVEAGPSPVLPGIDYRDLGAAWGDTTTRVNQNHVQERSGSSIGTWQARPAQEQLDADEVLTGLGEGAVFVPSMTQGRLEPRVSVLGPNGKVVAMGASGRRIRLPPGP